MTKSANLLGHVLHPRYGPFTARHTAWIRRMFIDSHSQQGRAEHGLGTLQVLFHCCHAAIYTRIDDCVKPLREKISINAWE
jgi:hypothetical protein